MSLDLLNLVLSTTTAPGTERFALAYLAYQANDDGLSWPSISTIAKRLCISESQARRAVHSLIAKELISVVDNSTGGRTSRTYRINDERLTPSADARGTPSMDARGMDTDTPSADARGTPSMDARTPSMDARDPLHGCYPINIDKHDKHVDRATGTFELKPVSTDSKKTKSLSETVFDAERELLNHGVHPDVVQEFIDHRKTKKAKISKIALDGIIRESKLANVTLETALRECIEANWISFRANWFVNRNRATEQASQQAAQTPWARGI